MYLSKRRYVKNWEHDIKNNWSVTVKNNGKKITDKYPIEAVEYSAGQWRKANQIHNWFVINIGEGRDDQQRMYVSHKKLQQLLDTVNEVLASTTLIDAKVVNGYTFRNGEKIPNIENGKKLKDPTVAEGLLPTSSGYFFGSEDYDQWYWEQLLETREILEAALADEDGEFYYEASW